MKRNMNLQFFAEPEETTGTNVQQKPQATEGNQQTSSTPAIDYEKIASLVSGKQQVAEETVLKSYFKQQGLSQEEAQQATIEKEATIEALTLDLDSKTIPYVLKLADMSKVMGEDGKVNNEELKKALNKVLEDVPQLKPTTEDSKGFQMPFYFLFWFKLRV